MVNFEENTIRKVEYSENGTSDKRHFSTIDFMLFRLPCNLHCYTDFYCFDTIVNMSTYGCFLHSHGMLSFIQQNRDQSIQMKQKQYPYYNFFLIP